MHTLAKQPLISMGQVRHSRLRPAVNSFRYGVYTLLLPLRTLGDAPLPTRLCSRNRFNLLSFHDADHGDGRTPLLDWVGSLLASEGIDDADGEIWLQTFPRVLGYVFNPVSFWFCHRKDGALRAIVCEVNNTFGERHCYLLYKDSGEPILSGESLKSKKVFHVSPFCEVRGEYLFRFLFSQDSQSGANSVARIELHEDSAPLINTSISGTSKPLNRHHLYSALVRYPLMSLGVIFRIHWQALKLWIKGVPFYSKPKPPEFEISR